MRQCVCNINMRENGSMITGKLQVLFLHFGVVVKMLFSQSDDCRFKSPLQQYLKLSVLEQTNKTTNGISKIVALDICCLCQIIMLVAYDICCIIGFVRYEVCRLIGFVAIRLLLPFMTFVAQRVCCSILLYITLLEQFWQIQLYLTDDANAKLRET